MKNPQFLIYQDIYSPVHQKMERLYINSNNAFGPKDEARAFSEEMAKAWMALHVNIECFLETCPEGKVAGGRVRGSECLQDGETISEYNARIKGRVSASEVAMGIAYKRQEILKKASDAISKDRQTSYGTPESNFANIANFWNDYLRARGISDPHHPLLTPKDVASMMILLKIARTVTSPNHDDNWIDIAGYSGCAAEIVQ